MTGRGQDAPAGTVDPAEVERFARLADRWWDPAGEFKPLHRLNPVRLAFIRDRLQRHFGRDPKSLAPFAGLRLLDIGCGGGLIAEPMARLGFTVTGIDADAAALATAGAHAAMTSLSIDYRAAAAEDLADERERFDVVLALEVVEHVADPGLFFAAAAALVRPGGALVAATINRTMKAYLLAIVGAEMVLRWLPRGTHRWEKFLRPSELAALVRAQDMDVKELCGMVYEPAADRWVLGGDLDTNYLLFATKAPAK
ncbi:MAG TPA: bifunctional 2-polyprenyl-6-hydroxyphenol methylase/3-demethylubiquinol 3-O-methyltransferase UbiG [Stellaceae bacterium]|nr:bifunctional 2-polyprenyl-6-hydroxyphenol methylase/3-demethylubiquinol 3-O-methyltransferase UbiG [Stellaceae bacterium]